MESDHYCTEHILSSPQLLVHIHPSHPTLSYIDPGKVHLPHESLN